MSVYTTINVTRSTAKLTLLKTIASVIPDALLGDLLDVVLREQCYNVWIVPDDTQENDDSLVRGY